ncbi:MAG: MATE family efflux transporter, partial [Oscillospiraceae bacterium]|nr:MATE family efflux transporter [Oscillospiraceae bacterium]
MKTADRSMLEGPLFRNIILYTIPVMLTGVLQLLFNAADLVIVGRFCGSLSVAAVGATGAITNLIVNLFIGLSVGAGVTVAHGLGGEDDEVVHRTVHTAVPTAVITGLILAVIGICAAKPVLRWMDTPDNVLPLSALYMQIYFAGMPASMLYNFCASILRAAGDTKSPLKYLTLAGVINVALNVVFVTQFHMNVAGVALATIISQVVSGALVLRTLMLRTDSCRFEFGKMHIYKPQLMKMIRIGMPAGVQGSMFAISNVIIQSSINSFGDAVMSGNAAAGNIEGFLYIAMNGFQQ